MATDPLNVAAPLAQGGAMPPPQLGMPGPGGPMPVMPPQRNLNQEWEGWMGQPGNRQMMIQMGLQLMQPIGLGQNLSGHIGQAIGSGAAAADRAITGQEEQDLANREQSVRERAVAIDEKRLTIDDKRAQAAILAASRGGKGKSFQQFVSDFLKNFLDPKEGIELLEDEAEIQRLQDIYMRLQRVESGLPAPVSQGGGGGDLPTAMNDDEYALVPTGSMYIGPDGGTYGPKP